MFNRKWLGNVQDRNVRDRVQSIGWCGSNGGRPNALDEPFEAQITPYRAGRDGRKERAGGRGSNGMCRWGGACPLMPTRTQRTLVFEHNGKRYTSRTRWKCRRHPLEDHLRPRTIRKFQSRSWQACSIGSPSLQIRTQW